MNLVTIRCLVTILSPHVPIENQLMTIPFILLVIGLTIVSFGTSLPELVTLVVAAFRKTSDIAIGNFIGSNIFNMFFIPGVCSLIVFSVLLFAFSSAERSINRTVGNRQSYCWDMQGKNES
jgi:Ca2+/Na+ antiporter